MTPPQAPTARRFDTVARVVTEVSAPTVVNAAGSLTIGIHAGSLAWGLAVALCSGVIPFAFILWQLRSRRVSDHHVTNREQRTTVLAVILVLVVGVFVASLLLPAPREVIALTSSMLVGLLATAAVTVLLHWKISFHAAVAAGSTIVVAYALGGVWWLLLLAVPVVLWSRVRLEDHSTGQVLAGAAVGAAVSGLVFASLAG